MPTPGPIFEHISFGRLNSLVGSGADFNLCVAWESYSGANSYSVTVDVGGVVQNIDTAETQCWFALNAVPDADDTVTIIADLGGGLFTDPSEDNLGLLAVTAPTEVFGTLKTSCHAVFTKDTYAANWSWLLTGAPAGVAISAKTDDSPGGTISGVPTVEGVHYATVELRNYTAAAIEYNVQQFPLTIHVDGERYLAAFHADSSRTSLNIRHNVGTVASWNFNAQSELPLTLGDEKVIHAILRDGTSYIGTGVTNLKLVAKLTNRLDGPVVLKAEAASPTVASFGATVKGWPLTVSVDSAFARRIFDNANTPPGEAPASISQLLDAQISYTHGGKTHRSHPFKIRLSQPIAQL